MITRNSLPQYKTGHPIAHKDLNNLRSEVQRMGRIKGASPIQVSTDATGITIGLTNFGLVRFGFAHLINQVNANGKGQAEPYTVDNAPDGNWHLDDLAKHNITVYAPPTLGSDQYYATGSVVTIGYNSDWKRWVILSAPYGNCN